MRNIVRWSTSSYRAVSSVSLWQTNDHRYTRFFHCTIFKVPTHNILYDRETVSNIQNERYPSGGRLARLIGGEEGAHKDEHAPEEHRQRDVFVEEEGAPDHGAEGDQKGDGQ